MSSIFPNSLVLLHPSKCHTNFSQGGHKQTSTHSYNKLKYDPSYNLKNRWVYEAYRAQVEFLSGVWVAPNAAPLRHLTQTLRPWGYVQLRQNCMQMSGKERAGKVKVQCPPQASFCGNIKNQHGGSHGDPSQDDSCCTQGIEFYSTVLHSQSVNPNVSDLNTYLQCMNTKQ